MKEELLRFTKKQKYIIFDYETCNLNLISTKNKPWQLAFMLFQGDKVLDQADYILNWKNKREYFPKISRRLVGCCVRCDDVASKQLLLLLCCW